MNPIFTLPATCELCGNWLPGHSSACPRNGVHPSQWKLDQDLDESAALYDNDYEISFYFDKQESTSEQDIGLSH